MSKKLRRVISLIPIALLLQTTSSIGSDGVEKLPSHMNVQVQLDRHVDRIVLVDNTTITWSKDSSVHLPVVDGKLRIDSYLCYIRQNCDLLEINYLTVAHQPAALVWFRLQTGGNTFTDLGSTGQVATQSLELASVLIRGIDATWTIQMEARPAVCASHHSDFRAFLAGLSI
jgi:hypothetical protein